jgi:protein Tex
MNITQIIADELKIDPSKVESTLALLEGGATVPFISRYRKDQTGGLDEIQVRDIQHRMEYFAELAERKNTVIKSIEEQGKMTPELRKQIDDCVNKVLLEDLYLPYKPKRKTKATIAKDLGLEPLARIIEAQEETSNTAEEIARIYLNEEKGLVDWEDIISKALDILAEEVADHAEYRQHLRNHAQKEGFLVSAVRKEFAEKQTKFENYYDFKEKIKTIPSHRILAVRRGEKEKVLRLSIEVDDGLMVSYLQRNVVKKPSIWSAFLDKMCKDSYERLMKGAMETEVRLEMKKRADDEALQVFGKNLSDILLAPPAGHKSVLALDPGFKSGCKVAVMDENGKFVEKTVIYPNAPQNQTVEAAKTIVELVAKHNVELIAIGNGTASRETDAFVAKLMPKFAAPKPARIVVSEAGASVYSASMIAIEEFPKEDVTTRGAISIGRRLQDPLAELVKVDPKSIGVGQYQHDVDQKALKKNLDEVVESCVNMVGVDLNSASEPLLSYVAGINKTLARNIVKYRDDHGGFKSRAELLKVTGMGPKAYEQCAGFLRITQGGENPLDGSAVHPENYELVEKIAQKAGVELQKIIGHAQALKDIELEEFLDERVGKHTLEDILAELEKPNRDPRKEFQYAAFDDKIQDIQDLVTGSWMEGVVTNVTNFGAFVDVGVHQDGLVHVSEIADKFVTDAKTVVAVGDVVKVRVLGVDAGQKRISLSMKKEESAPTQRGGGKHTKGAAPKGKFKGPERAHIQPNATIADLRNKFEQGGSKSQKAKEKRPTPQKPQISIKSIMRSGR